MKITILGTPTAEFLDTDDLHKFLTEIYTVEFEDWDASNLKTEYVDKNFDATAPTDPTRTDYIFDGWDVAYNNITANLTVTAEYTYDPSLYAFTSHTFNPGAALGQYGPTLAQCQTEYAGEVWLNDYFDMNIQGQQLWTVPKDGTYRITAKGAAGADESGQFGGHGASMRGDFVLTKGDVLKIVVGQMGTTNSGDGSGGGGGSFVWTDSVGGPGKMIIAGGGGGSGEENTASGKDGQAGTSALNGDGGASVAAGLAGVGGARSSAGCGWAGDASGSSDSDIDGLRFIGGLHHDGVDDGGGGFGGGGAGENSDGGGAGGGYTGGSGTDSSDRLDWGGSGAGSYNGGTNQSNITGDNIGAGSVLIEQL